MVWGQVVRVALLALQNLLAAPGLELAPEMVEAGLPKVVQQRLVQVRIFPRASCLEHPDVHCQHRHNWTPKLVHFCQMQEHCCCQKSWWLLWVLGSGKADHLWVCRTGRMRM